MVERIIICGNIAGCGKTTAANYLVSQYGFKESFFAEGVYDIAKKYLNMQEKNRKMLIDIGQKMREIDPEVWIKYTFSQANNNRLSVISDCRQENEYFQGVMNGYLPIRIAANRENAIKRIIKRDGYCDESLLDTEGEIGTRHIPMINIYNNDKPDVMYKDLDNLVKNFQTEPYMEHLKVSVKHAIEMGEMRSRL